MRQSEESKSIPDEKIQSDILNTHTHYTKIFNALKDLEEYNVQLSVPEFVFIGFQSSGKTSAVSQAAKLAVGTMKHGTASRCPTRFKLISNPKQTQPLIKVNGQICANEEDLTNKTFQITNKYEKQEIFSKEIIEVRIESAQVPELTFVDLPGLIKGDNTQFATAKRQLDELTAHFLHEQNPDNTYRYIPILVREPVDEEHDTHFEVEYIDSLVEKYGQGRKRINWREDTLFVVNKFDKQINRAPAASLIEYMNYVCAYGNTVITIMNAQNENTANMAQKELNTFVDSVALKEEQKWEQVLTEFSNMDDENLLELAALKHSICGVNKMNEILSEKMCEIVKRILPSLERELVKAEKQKRTEIAQIMKQIAMCDPQKLKGQCIAFNNKFLKHSRKFYSGECVMKVDAKYKKTWTQEMDDFHRQNKEKSVAWEYEMQANTLQRLLSKLGNRETPKLLVMKLKMELMASAAINRIIDAWQSMVSYMSFPRYTHEDIMNICGAFLSTRQPNIWNSVRNVVLHSVQHLSDAILFIAELLRYKLKENANIIFELSLFEEFGTNATAMNPKQGILQLFQRSLRDYKKQIDVVINEFVALACRGPMERAKILDKFVCEESINIGRLVQKMLSPQNKPKFIQKPKDTRNGNAPPPPPPSSRMPPKSPTPTLSQSSTDLVGKPSKLSDDTRGKNKEKEREPTPPNIIESELIFMAKYDELFYSAVYGENSQFPVTYESNDYEIGLVRHLSYVYWANLKCDTLRDVKQKITRLIMAPIKQENELISDAIHCGVDGREIQRIMDELVKRTGLDVLALQKLITSQSTMPVPKAIHDLDNDELQKIYGIDRTELLKEKANKIHELKQFKQLKANTLTKIYHIQKNQFEEI